MMMKGTTDYVDRQQSCLPQKEAASHGAGLLGILQWTDISMLDQARRGNQIEGVFRKQAWTEMVNLFNAIYKSCFDVDVLKNRYKTLRRQSNSIKSLLRSDGFTWDDERQMVTADDNVWQDYIKAHRDARQFMTRPIPYYKDLCVLCGDSGIEENDCFVAMDWFDPETEFQEFKSSGTTDLSISAEEEDSNSLLFDPKNKRDQIANTDTIPINPKKPPVDETKTMAIEDTVEELILDACDLLEDELKAKTFLALDVKLRKKWLLRKLRPQVLGSVNDLAQIMKDLSALVIEQGPIVDRIDYIIQNVSTSVEEGYKQLQKLCFFTKNSQVFVNTTDFSPYRGIFQFLNRRKEHKEKEQWGNVLRYFLYCVS